MDVDDFHPPIRDMSLDASFDIPGRRLSFIPEPLEQTFNVNDETLPSEVPDDVEVTYRIIEKGSKRGGRLLLSSDGYSYGVKAVNKSSTRWFCSVRSKTNRCCATVSQVGEAFFPGINRHSHPGDPKLSLRVELQKQLDIDFIKSPEFLTGDLRTEDGQRHIIFSTSYQQRILRQSRRWFMDGTFKAVTGPFQKRGQLFTINAFVKGECGELKQFPLMFVLMSRKTKEDYAMILRHLQTAVGPFNVEGFVADFEKALWQALRDVLPGIPIKGCVFHFNQAVWRRTQELGLSTAYREEPSIRGYVRQLMALPFLPPRHIAPAFENLRNRATTTQLQSLVDYINRQWISNPIFPVETWSVYRLTVRTNNDTEGWHTRLNQKSGGAPGLYRLVQLLKMEAELVEASIAAGDLTRETNTNYRRLDEKLTEAWDNYQAGTTATGTFLRTVGNLYGFVV